LNLFSRVLRISRLLLSAQASGSAKPLARQGVIALRACIVNSNFENALESTTLLFCLAVVSCVGVSTDAQEPVADTVYTDGKIYTVNEEALGRNRGNQGWRVH
jgi:hypothetical protein